MRDVQSNEIAARNEQIGMSQLSVARADFEAVLGEIILPDNRDRTVQRQLMVIAEMRQASISAETLRLYGRALRAYAMEDIQAAIMHYRMPCNVRQQGETAMPDLPSLEGVIQTCRGTRIRAAAAAAAVAEEEKMRKEYEAEVAAGLHEPDPATRETMARLNRVLEEKKSGAMSLSGALASGDSRRAAETRRRAAEAKAAGQEKVPCSKCAFWDTLTPEDLRKLADTREKRNAEMATAESEVAA